MKITINEPCHENWGDMTPNQKGAFCKSCMKDVVDFSKKSIDEIKNFFSKPRGKVCGRFEEKQLQELSFDDFFARFTYWNFSKKFVVIFFMAFGFWIFSNTTAFAQDKYPKGEVAYVPEEKPVKKAPEKVHVLGEPAVKKTAPVMGRIKCTKPLPKETPVKKVAPAQEKKMIKGKIAVIKHTEKPAQPRPPVKTKPVAEPQKAIEKEAIMGLIAYFPEEQKRPVKPLHVGTTITSEVTETPIKKDLPMNEHDKVVLLYPNPNNGFFTIETTEKKTMRIFDATGRMVHTQTVDGSTKVNISHLPDGAYSISLAGATKTTHTKIIVTR